MERIKCIFCNIENDQVFIEEKGYIGRKCSNCNLIFISPRPAFAEILNIYGHDDAFVSAEDHITNDFIKRLYARHNLSIIKKYKKSGTLLEIGAGAGYFLDEAKKLGFEAYGIELNPIQADFITKTLKIPCETKPLDSSFFHEKRFDIIYHCDVLSHFYDPIAEFQKINDKLADGGLCVFETGNFSDVEDSYLTKIESFHYPTHLFFFGENNLKQLLTLTGFKLVKMYNYSLLAEFFIDKAVRKVFRLIKIITGKTNLDSYYVHPAKILPTHKAGSFNLRRLRWHLYKYLIYLGRYQIGSIIPKPGRPQTLIVVAQKQTQSK